MDTLELLARGFGIALQPTNVMFALVGCAMGTLVGVLPGLGSTAAIGILLPFTFGLPPTPAIIMLAALYWGSMYGGTITSVLLNVPGEASSAITCIDGYQMARQGRAGSALAVAAIGSFIGGTAATMALVFIAVPLTALALKFGPPEILALLFMTLALVTGLAGSSMIRGFLSMFLGLLVSMVGLDPGMGAARFTFGVPELLGGISFIPVVMGMFGVAEVFLSVEGRAKEMPDVRIRSVTLSLKDMKESAWSVVRGTLVGFLLGLIPGLTGVVASVAAYMAEKHFAKNPERFGSGAIEGVAGPETANNAYATGAVVPLFTLGIPGSPSVAVLMGAFMMNGLIPGPFLFVEHSDFIWAVIASMYVANVILLIFNLPLIPLWVAVLRIPQPILYAFILSFCVLGAYSLHNQVFDVGMMVGFGVLGYAFRKLDIPVAPFIVTIILGPLTERALYRTLEMSMGDFGILLTRPVAAVFLLITAAVIVAASLKFANQFKGDSR